MEIRALTRDEIQYVYDELMPRDFIPDEIKPLSHIHKMMADGVYVFYGLFEETELRAYVSACCLPEFPFFIGDYLAVTSDQRGKGYGTYLLKHMREVCPDIEGYAFEVEDPRFAEAQDERDYRSRRIAFYERNGAVLTRVRTWVYYCDFMVMFLPFTGVPEDGVLRNAMDRFYHTIVQPNIYNEYTRVGFEEDMPLWREEP